MDLAAGSGLESVDEDAKKDPPAVRDLVRSYLEASSWSVNLRTCTAPYAFGSTSYNGPHESYRI